MPELGDPGNPDDYVPGEDEDIPTRKEATPMIDPTAIQFWDRTKARWLKIVDGGWLHYQATTGEWFPFRKLTAEDVNALQGAIVDLTLTEQRR